MIQQQLRLKFVLLVLQLLVFLLHHLQNRIPLKLLFLLRVPLTCENTVLPQKERKFFLKSLLLVNMCKITKILLLLQYHQVAVLVLDLFFFFPVYRLLLLFWLVLLYMVLQQKQLQKLAEMLLICLPT